ncbi:hypothetical protein [Bradyrhizobium iriomotense]|uniref:DUF4198 domain-containing protein n=1 Tax=Bradyrhizobium iriomotense TaxID=441950 RepID=A0ABQ6AYK2_9BRAD|nr:hypothetical protein [Bradyrhizobium iriomotense]GLR84968.1 hypothetical protein GCM10007857_16780 [Bradyrhizobium iriomotense]
MKSRTLGVLIVGGLIVATAVLARPVAASLGQESAADTIQFGWSRTSGSNDYVDQTWWAVRSHCAPDSFAERLLCIPVAVMARRAGAGFEAKLSQDTGLPLPDGWALTTAKNSPLIRSVYAETPRDLAAVVGFYRGELGKRGWTENDGAVVGPDRAVIAFTTAEGPALLRLSRQDDKTIAELSLRKPGVVNAGMLPTPGQARLMLGNKTDDDADITINEQTIKLAAGAGGKLADSDDEPGKLPDSQKIDLPPGKYKVTLKVAGGAAQNREFEVAANETWGLLVGTDGVLLPMHLY